MSIDQERESDIDELSRDSLAPLLNGPINIRSTALFGILILMLLYTCYSAAEVLMPITLAFLLNLLLSPLILWMGRYYVPPPLGAALVLLVVLSVFVAGVYGLSGPASNWFERAPQIAERIHFKLQAFEQPLHEIQAVKKRVEKITQGGNASKQEKKGGSFDLTGMIMTNTRAALYGIGVTVVLLYFLLASGDRFLRSLARVIPRWRDKKRAVEIARSIQFHISRYLGTVALINIGLGLVVGLAMWILGMPNPELWGAMVAIFNFIPYVGATVSIIILSLVALFSLNGIGHILLVPIVTLCCTTMEGQFITPHIVGRRLELSPVAIFMTLVILGWMWGIIGALIAVPLLTAFKILCEELKPLRSIAEFLGT